MKTSFYFVLWILIYPILSLIPGVAVQEYSFLVALVAVFGLSYLIRKLMPGTLVYENMANSVSIMENIYNDKVADFRRRINGEATVETISAFYFAVTSVVLLWVIMNSDSYDLFALIIFVFLAIGAFSRAEKLIRAARSLRRNPTAEECMKVAVDVYHLDYAMYYNARHGCELKDFLPPRPRYYTLFLVCSLIIAVVCGILGLLFVVVGGINLVHGFMFGGVGYGLINLLYGTLAMYFGIRDCITTFRQFSKRNRI